MGRAHFLTEYVVFLFNEATDIVGRSALPSRQSHMTALTWIRRVTATELEA